MRKMQLEGYKRFVLLTLSFTITSLIVNAQKGNVRGFVRTSDGQPAQFVSIQLKEIKGGVLSAEDGSYLLKNINEGKYTVLVSYVGLKPQAHTIKITGGETNEVDFTLPENADQLTEFVVAYNRGINEKPVSVGKINIKPMDLPQSIAIVGK